VAIVTRTMFQAREDGRCTNDPYWIPYTSRPDSPFCETVEDAIAFASDRISDALAASPPLNAIPRYIVNEYIEVRDDGTPTQFLDPS